MSVLIISANDLFKEVILQTVAQSQTPCIQLSPQEALTRVGDLRPDVIIVDEMIPPPYFESLLTEARSLPKTRTIVLNPDGNEIVLLDSRRATLRTADDLMEVVSAKGHVTHPENESFHVLKAGEAARKFAGITGFLASAFSRPPDASLVIRLRAIDPNAFAGLDLAPESRSNTSCGAKLIFEFIETTAELTEEEEIEMLEADWARLFGNARAAGCPAPYEAAHLEAGNGAVDLLERLVIEYSKGDAEIRGDQDARLDSIGAELEYLSFLAGQAAAAWEAGDQGRAHPLEEKACRFAQEHVGRWAEGYLISAFEYAQTNYFKGIIRLALGVISHFRRIGPASSFFQQLWGSSSFKPEGRSPASSSLLKNRDR